MREGQLSAGHAACVADRRIDPITLARLAVWPRGLSVREVEKRAQGQAARASARKGPRRKTPRTADTVSLEGDLSATVGMPVSIEHDSGQAVRAPSRSVFIADLEGLV